MPDLPSPCRSPSGSRSRCAPGHASLALACALLGLCSAWAPLRGAKAAGIETPELGAWAAGRGGAVAAQPTQGLALQFNPAGMAFARGLHLGVNGKAVWQNVRFTPVNQALYVAGGHLAENTAVPYLGPTDGTLIYARRLWGGFGTLAGGLGAIGPSATGALTYPYDGPQRYNNISRDTFLAYLSGGAALRLGPVAIGGTLQLARGSIRQSQAVQGLTFPTAKDITATFDGSLGWATTGVLGISASLGPHVAVGASWRPGFGLGGVGTLAVSLPDTLASLAKVTGDQAALRLAFPHVVRLGVMWRPVRRLQLEVNGVYEGWSALQQIDITPVNISIKPIILPAQTLGPIAQQKHWQDIFGLRVGGELSLLRGHLALRAGYFLDPSAIPSAYAGVDFPNFTAHAFSFGATVTLFGAHLDLALVQHVRPSLLTVDGQLTATTTPLSPTLHVINNGLIDTQVTALAIGLRLPLQGLHRAP